MRPNGTFTAKSQGDVPTARIADATDGATAAAMGHHEAVQPDPTAEMRVRIGVANQRPVHADDRRAADALRQCAPHQQRQAVRKRAAERAEREDPPPAA